MGVEKDCSELFKTTVIDLGLCCSFNILPEVLLHDKPFEKPDIKEEVLILLLTFAVCFSFSMLFAYFPHTIILIFLKTWNPQDGFSHPQQQVQADTPLEVPFRSLSSGVTNGVSFMLNLEVQCIKSFRNIKMINIPLNGYREISMVAQLMLQVDLK